MSSGSVCYNMNLWGIEILSKADLVSNDWCNMRCIIIIHFLDTFSMHDSCVMFDWFLIAIAVNFILLFLKSYGCLPSTLESESVHCFEINYFAKIMIHAVSHLSHAVTRIYGHIHDTVYLQSWHANLHACIGYFLDYLAWVSSSEILCFSVILNYHFVGLTCPFLIIFISL